MLLRSVAEQRPVVVDSRVEGGHPLELRRHQALSPDERGGNGLGLVGGRGSVIMMLGRRRRAEAEAPRAPRGDDSASVAVTVGMV